MNLAPPMHPYGFGALGTSRRGRLGVAVSASLIEVALRPDRAWLLATLAVSIVVALSLLWRRTHPLAAVAVAFGTLIDFDLARIVASSTFPKRTSLQLHSQDQFDEVAAELNGRPRKTLQFMTPSQKLAEAVATIP